MKWTQKRSHTVEIPEMKTYQTRSSQSVQKKSPTDYNYDDFNHKAKAKDFRGRCCCVIFIVRLICHFTFVMFILVGDDIKKAHFIQRIYYTTITVTNVLHKVINRSLFIAKCKY